MMTDQEHYRKVTIEEIQAHLKNQVLEMKANGHWSKESIDFRVQMIGELELLK